MRSLAASAAPPAIAIPVAAALTLAGGKGTLVAAAALLTLVGALLPCRIVVRLVLIASALTYFKLPIQGVNLRLDMALAPSALISATRDPHLSAALHRWLRHPVLRLLGLLVALEAVTSLRSAPDVAKSERIVVWMAANLVLLLVCLAYFEVSRTDATRALLAIGMGVVVIGLVGWLLDRQGLPSWGVAQLDNTGLRRARGVALEPNILAGIATLCSVILLVRRRRIGRGWVLIVLSLAVIPLTGTRTAFIALPVGLVAVAARSGPRYWLRLAHIGLALAAAAGVLSMFAYSLVRPFFDKLGSIRFHDDNSVVRYRSWSLAIHDLHGTDWLTGLGTNSFGQRHLDPTTVYLSNPQPGYIGALPLQLLYEVGIIGLIVAGAVVWKLLSIAPSREARIRWVGALLSFLVVSSSTSPFYFAYFWLLVIPALLASQSEPDAPPVPSASRRIQRPGAVHAQSASLAASGR